jgi:hypothetical protein
VGPLTLLAWLTGCTGGGTAQLVPITRSDLPPGEPLVQQIPIHEAFYTQQPDGRLIIGLRRHERSLLSSGLDLTWLMSLVLEGMPAGNERLYHVGAYEGRTLQSLGADHRRWRSTFGLVCIESPSGGRLRGRFHLTVQQQQFSILAGWSPQLYRGAVLTLVGEFEAVENAGAASEIVTLTEADGFERKVTPAISSLPTWRRTAPSSAPGP